MAFTLSLIGCLVLINSVILSSKIHSFMIYWWPSSLLKKLETAMRNFFWTGVIDVLKVVTVSWKNVCLTKECGRLG